MTATAPGGWLPRTPYEALVKAAALLDSTAPLVPVARARIVDVLPGHSGHPIGAGDVAGRSAPTSSTSDDDAGPFTVVERNALIASDPAWRDLEHLDQLADTIIAATGALIARPSLLTGVHRDRLLAQACRVLQRLAELPSARYDRRTVRQLYNATHDLHRLATTWADPRPGAPRSPTLAIDNSGTLCTSCLRTGHRTERSERYAARCPVPLVRRLQRRTGLPANARHRRRAPRRRPRIHDRPTDSRGPPGPPEAVPQAPPISPRRDTRVTQEPVNRQEVMRTSETKNRRYIEESVHRRRSRDCVCHFQPNWPSDPGYRS